VYTVANKTYSYILIALRATDDGYPLAQRIKRLFKYALRALDMRSLFVDYGSIPTPTPALDARSASETTSTLPVNTVNSAFPSHFLADTEIGLD
jgi:hypothetical protein